MALTETTRYFLGIEDDGQIRFRKTRVIFDTTLPPGDQIVGERHHSQVLEPGQNVTSFPGKIRNICAVVWTPAVIAAYLAAKAAQNP